MPLDFGLVSLAYLASLAIDCFCGILVRAGGFYDFYDFC